MKTIAIIGGGWSGTLTAIHLLEKSKNVLVKIINAGQPIATGVAYSTTAEEHLLNVPAGKMSAFPEKPNHFINWLETNQYKSDNIAAEFIPRLIYGKYILELFNSYRSNEQMELIDSRAIDIQIHEGIYTILLEDGKSVNADKIVLALGNFLPSQPKSNTPSFFECVDYFQNPWGSDYLKEIQLNKNILLIGTGLTMVDCVLSLKKAEFKGQIFVVSPRGYTPASHGKSNIYPDFYNELKGLTLIEIFKTVRKHLSIAESKNISWRGVIDSLRPHVQNIWISLSSKEKQQFISHIRHIWGIARHRLPVETHKELFSLKENGQLEVIGGRILDMQEKNGIISIPVRLRKSTEIRELQVSRVINCTGPQINYKELKDKLVLNLLAKRMILADELKMGIQTTATGQVIEQEGKISKDIYAIGSLLRGVLWETTAVPEIRLQADSISRQIVDSI